MDWFLGFHLATIVPALLLGPFVLGRKKGDAAHRRMGRVWVWLMIAAALSSFGIRAAGRMSGLHLLSAFTIYAVLRGLGAASQGNIVQHRRSMVGAYVGSVIALVYALRPERLLGDYLWGLMP